MTRLLLGAELVLLFVVIPLLFYFNLIPGPKSVPLLLAFVYCLLILLFDKKFDRKILRVRRFSNFRYVFSRFLFGAGLMTLYVLIFEPDNFLLIPREQPFLWLAIMVFYPIWSAVPQELIFRVYFFHRYRNLLPQLNVAVFINALLFAYMHIIFNNWVAVVGSFIVGIFWAQTYMRTKSLLTVSAEHVFYGNFIYTVGLGHYFYVPDF